MTDILVVAKFTHLSGMPNDRVMNTFAFTTSESSGISSVVVGEVEAQLQAFFNDTPSGGDPICSAISGTMDRTAGAVKVDFFDLTGHLDGTAHGSPVMTGGFTLGAEAAGVTRYPSEVAIALSFHADYGLDPEFGPITPRPPGLGDPTKPYHPRLRARDRGRLFIGPMNNHWTAFDSHLRASVNTTGRSSLGGQAHALVAKTGTGVSSGFPTWCVWSRRDAALKPVISGWVDDAYDTQRRRGEDAGSKTLWF